MQGILAFLVAIHHTQKYLIDQIDGAAYFERMFMTVALTASRVSPEFPDLSDETIAELTISMNRTGYGIVPGYVGQNDLDDLRSFAENVVQAAGHEYVCFTGYNDLAGTVLERMAQSPVFRRLCTRLYEHATGKHAPDQPYYQILRCLAGQSGRRHSMRLHYDSYVLTIL